MKEKHKHSLKITAGLGDSYKHYKNKKGALAIDKKEYVNICYLVNKKISNKIIKESLEFKLPFRLGSISIRKNEMKIRVKNGKIQKNKMIIDWEATWKYWLEEYPGKTRKEIRALPGKIVIYQTNEHSNGYIMKWFWDKTGCSFINTTLYKFKTTKQNRLDLATHIKSGEKENDYYLQKEFKTHGKEKTNQGS